MALNLANDLLGYLRGAVGAPHAAVSDRDLIQHFARHHDEESFRALVQRHGAMVRGTCLRVLGNPHDADDAFQATFLVLARRGGSIRENSVGPWLHQVAQRAARRLRASIAQRRDQERQAPPPPARPADEVTLRELQQALDEEIAALPELYRAVLVLCCLEGKTRDEAAQELGWSPGSLKGRLERARALLQERLAWRGLALSLAFLALTLAPASASAALASATVKGAAAFAAGAPLTGLVSALAAELAAAVLAETATGWLAKAALAGAFALVFLGAGFLAVPGEAERPAAPPPAPVARAEQPPPAPPRPQKPPPAPPEEVTAPQQRLKEAEQAYLKKREAMRQELLGLEKKAQAAVEAALAEMRRPGLGAAARRQATAAYHRAVNELNAVRETRFEVERAKIMGQPARRVGPGK